MAGTPVARCEACWRDTEQVTYCVGCRLTLCPGCRGDDLVTCDGCNSRSLRSRRRVVALARRATEVLAEAELEAHALAGRANEHATWARPASSDEYGAALIEMLQRDLALTVAKGEAAELAGAYAVPGLPARSVGRADEVQAAATRYRAARERASSAIDAIATSRSSAAATARRQVLLRRAVAVLVILAVAMGAVPVLERLF